jgi:HK97 gp10 family phage protein
MVEGLARFNARWAAIPERVREEVTRAMETVAPLIVADMRRLAPKGDTLRVASSINWTWGDAPAGTMVLGSFGAKGGKNVDYGTLRITFYAAGGAAFYGKFHEFGTRKMTASPFFYPVWRVWKRRVRSRIRSAISRGIKAS